MFELPPKYLEEGAREGDVGVWFGERKDRYGCEGYAACDKVHVLETYYLSDDNDNNDDEALESW